MGLWGCVKSRVCSSRQFVSFANLEFDPNTDFAAFGRVVMSEWKQTSNKCSSDLLQGMSHILVRPRCLLWAAYTGTAFPRSHWATLEISLNTYSLSISVVAQHFLCSEVWLKLCHSSYHKQWQLVRQVVADASHCPHSCHYKTPTQIGALLCEMRPL